MQKNKLIDNLSVYSCSVSDVGDIIEEAIKNGDKKIALIVTIGAKPKELLEYSIKDLVVDIIHTVASHYGYRLEDLMSKSRNGGMVDVRQLCMYILLKKMQLSTVTVGRLFGRDHTTVIHARDKIEAMLFTKDPLIYGHYAEVVNKVNKVLNYNE